MYEKVHLPKCLVSMFNLWEQYLKSTFDALYREGGKMMNIPLHSRISTVKHSFARLHLLIGSAVGKPGRSEALRGFMKYIQDKPGVWVATRREIAAHFRKEFPYKPGKLA